MNENQRGLRALVGCCLAIFWPGALVFGFPGVMSSLWAESFQVGRGAIGTTMFFVLAGVGSFMFLAGRWQVRFGPRRLIQVGTVVHALPTVVVGLWPSLAMVYAWAFCMGVGSSLIYMPGMTIVQQWYPGRRGLVTGLVSLVFGIGAAITSPLMGFLLTHVGYEWTALILAGITAACGLAAALWTSVPDSPISPPASAKGRPAVSLEDSLTVGQAVRSRAFWFLYAVWALMGAGGISMVMLSTAYGMHRFKTLQAAVVLLTCFNLTSGLSRLAMGFLSDLIGRHLAMSLAFFGAGLAYLGLGYVDGLVGAALLAAVIGVAFGTLFSVSAPLASDCFGLMNFGAIFGLVFTAYGFLAGLLGPTLSGVMLDLTGQDFKAVFAYLAVFSLISGGLIWFVRRPPAPTSAA